MEDTLSLLHLHRADLTRRLHNRPLPVRHLDNHLEQSISVLPD